MQKSLFEVAQMDCGAEENLVRLQLQNIDAVRNLGIDPPYAQSHIF